MTDQNGELKSAVGAQAKRIDAVERVIVTNEKRAEGRYDKMDKRIDSCKKSTKDSIKKLEDRLTALEIGGPQTAPKQEGAQPPQQGGRVGEWVPRHVVVGGWGETTSRDHILEDMEKWLSTRPQEVQSLILAPYTPKQYRPICKIRTE